MESTKPIFTRFFSNCFRSGYLDVAVDLCVEEDEHDEGKDAEHDEAEDVVVVEVVVPWDSHGGSQLILGFFQKPCIWWWTERLCDLAAFATIAAVWFCVLRHMG